MKLCWPIAALLAAAPAAALTPVQLPPFSSFELQGGGEVTVRHGPVQRVVLSQGDPTVTRFRVDKGRLLIRACDGMCRNYRLKVDIVTPEFDAAAIRGGGSIEVQGRFPEQDSLALSIQGGGDIAAAGVGADRVAVSIQGGGAIDTRAGKSLAVAIQGGGQVSYCGAPSVSTAVRGGGTVRKGCRSERLTQR